SPPSSSDPPSDSSSRERSSSSDPSAPSVSWVVPSPRLVETVSDASCAQAPSSRAPAATRAAAVRRRGTSGSGTGAPGTGRGRTPPSYLTLGLLHSGGVPPPPAGGYAGDRFRVRERTCALGCSHGHEPGAAPARRGPRPRHLRRRGRR